MSSGPLPLLPKVALRHYAMAHGGCPHRSSEGVPPVAAHCCRGAVHYACAACCRWQYMCQAPRCRLGAAGLMLGVALLATLAQKLCLARFRNRPLAVSPWMAEGFMPVWRAGACSHDGLTLQTAVHGSLGCRGAPVLAACIAQLMRVRRHCSAAAGPLCCLLWRAPLGS